MSLNINEILNKRKEIEVDLGGGVKLDLTYNPSTFCVQSRENMSTFPTFIDWKCDFMSKSIIEWDAVGADGEDIEVSAEVLKTLPDMYIELIFEEMRKGASIDPKLESTSSDS